MNFIYIRHIVESCLPGAYSAANTELNSENSCYMAFRQLVQPVPEKDKQNPLTTEVSAFTAGRLEDVNISLI